MVKILRSKFISSNLFKSHTRQTACTNGSLVESSLPAAPQEINFKEILGEIIENNRLLNTSHDGVEINVNIRNEAPFISNKQQMEVLLHKLISNTIKNLSPESLKPFVYIKIHSHNSGTSISMRDNCKAVEKDTLDKIFGRVVLSPNTFDEIARPLYAVKHTVEELKGRIEVEDEPEYGTQFNIYLPGHYN